MYVFLKSLLYLLLCVDDIFLACKDISHLKALKDVLKGEFEIKDLSKIGKILGIERLRDIVTGVLTIS